MGDTACCWGGHKGFHMPRAQVRAMGTQGSQAGALFSLLHPLPDTGRGVPLSPAKLDPKQTCSLHSELYLVTSRAAWPQQLSMMTAAVEMPIVVEVDEVYQGLATDLAGKASRVPAALLSCPGCKHSVFPWPQQLSALPDGGAGWSEAAPPS